MENKKSILLVEDEENVLDSLHSKLVKNGFNILEAKDGEAGLKLSLEKHPNLILLDILMPKMDGMTMLKELRGDSWGKNVPVIILTNLTDRDEQRNKQITELEPTYYFVKADKTLEEVVEKVKEILGLSQ